MASSQDDGDGKNSFYRFLDSCVGRLGLEDLPTGLRLWLAVVVAILIFTLVTLKYDLLPHNALIPVLLPVFLMVLVFSAFLALHRGRSRKPPIIQEMDPSSFRGFLRTCESADYGIFVNVQVDPVEWFDPWAQVHLALQDSAARRMQFQAMYASDKNTLPHEPPMRLMPFRRLLIVAEDWNQLRTEIHGRGTPESHLRPLIDIHSCMGSPLGIVTVGPLANMVNNQGAKLGENVKKQWEATIGLREKTLNVLKTGSERSRRRHLKKDIKRMRMKRGKAKRGLDCALLFIDLCFG